MAKRIWVLVNIRLPSLLFLFFCCLQQKTDTKGRRHFWIPKSKKLSMYTFSCLCNGLSRSLVYKYFFQALSVVGNTFFKKGFYGYYDLHLRFWKKNPKTRIVFQNTLKFRVFAFVFIYKQSNYFFREIKIPINNWCINK